MIKSNCHTHTLYCDGKNTAEEMVLAAIEKGFVSLGFSGHSPMNFESVWGMKESDMKAYYDEIHALKERYTDKIDILCGLELDADYIGVNPEDYDYIIASVHQFHSDGVVYSIDNTPEELSECVDKVFGGNWNLMAKKYFDMVTKHVLSGNFDVVGHLDLITKFNDDCDLFDESAPEYRAYALKAVDDILEKRPNILFEVNAGAIFRRGNKRPYPADFILRYICEKGGRITITSDAHKTEGLDYAYDDVADYCRMCGFSSAYIIKSIGIEKITL